MVNSISVRRRLEYARGYLELGLYAEARTELDGVPAEQQEELDVLELEMDLLMETKQWSGVIDFATRVCSRNPASEKAWIAWAYALRELQKIEEARDVLLRAEPLHGTTCGVLHYNLACYYCLLGELAEARRRLARACEMDKNWSKAAKDDPDLKALHSARSSRD